MKASLDKLSELNHDISIGTKEIDSSVDLVDFSTDVLDFYKEFVKSFFSKIDGEGKEIIALMSELNRFSTPIKKVTLVNVSDPYKTYFEYISGMKVFISNEIAMIGNEDENAQIQKINDYKDRDVDFVSSLFVGKRKAEESVNLDDSMECLEVLVDYVYDQSKFNEIFSLFKHTMNENSPVLNDLIRFALGSISDFSYHLIHTVITNFQEIKSTANSKECAITPIINRKIQAKRMRVF